MKGQWVFLSVLLLCFQTGTLFSLGQQAQDRSVPNNRIELTDSLGRTVTLEKPPERIVQAGKSAFIIINTLYLFEEARDRVIAMSNPDQGQGLFAEAIDGRFPEKAVYGRNVSVEELLAHDPDLVVMKNFLAKSMDKTLSAL